MNSKQLINQSLTTTYQPFLNCL